MWKLDKPRNQRCTKDTRFVFLPSTHLIFLICGLSVQNFLILSCFLYKHEPLKIDQPNTSILQLCFQYFQYNNGKQ